MHETRWLVGIGLTSLATAVIASFLLAGPAPIAPAVPEIPTPAPETPAEKQATGTLRSLTGAHTRVAWVQDVGDGADTFALGDRLVLMGLDSDDGRGERAILNTPSNYAKPLITPSGARVVFSNRLTQQVSVVEWDGSPLAQLTSGTALTVWQDPEDGTEWVYVGKDKVEDAYRTVVRMPIDQPTAIELVWNQTLVGEEFQVSRDGRVAAGVFPWPRCGIAHLPNDSWTEVGTGCWTSMTPDTTYRMWFLDGAHRNLTIVDTTAERSWRVNISAASGIDGDEVYHPRWSNHPRVMTMTGPYRIGNSDNRIRGGGPDVEVFVGRFTPELTAIEIWVQVTDNDHADFYPDVWIDGDETSTLLEAPGSAVAEVDGLAPTDPLPGRLVVRARLVDQTTIPTPQDIRPYRRALVANEYLIEEILEGRYRQRRILAAHWVIKESRVLSGAARELGEVYRMTLEPYDDRPELEGQRLVMDTDHFELPLFYDLGR